MERRVYFSIESRPFYVKDTGQGFRAESLGLGVTSRTTVHYTWAEAYAAGKGDAWIDTVVALSEVAQEYISAKG